MMRKVMGAVFDAYVAGGLIELIISAAMWATAGR